jgi:hypothetical protein
VGVSWRLSVASAALRNAPTSRTTLSRHIQRRWRPQAPNCIGLNNKNRPPRASLASQNQLQTLQRVEEAAIAPTNHHTVHKFPMPLQRHSLLLCRVLPTQYNHQYQQHNTSEQLSSASRCSTRYEQRFEDARHHKTTIRWDSRPHHGSDATGRHRWYYWSPEYDEIHTPAAESHV